MTKKKNNRKFTQPKEVERGSKEPQPSTSAPPSYQEQAVFPPRQSTISQKIRDSGVPKNVQQVEPLKPHTDERDDWTSQGATKKIYPKNNKPKFSQPQEVDGGPKEPQHSTSAPSLHQEQAGFTPRPSTISQKIWDSGVPKNVQPVEPLKPHTDERDDWTTKGARKKIYPKNNKPKFSQPQEVDGGPKEPQHSTSAPSLHQEQAGFTPRPSPISQKIRDSGVPKNVQPVEPLKPHTDERDDWTTKGARKKIYPKNNKPKFSQPQEVDGGPKEPQHSTSAPSSHQEQAGFTPRPSTISQKIRDSGVPKNVQPVEPLKPHTDERDDWTTQGARKKIYPKNNNRKFTQPQEVERGSKEPQPSTSAPPSHQEQAGFPPRPSTISQKIRDSGVPKNVQPVESLKPHTDERDDWMSQGARKKIYPENNPRYKSSEQTLRQTKGYVTGKYHDSSNQAWRSPKGSNSNQGDKPKEQAVQPLRQINDPSNKEVKYQLIEPTPGRNGKPLRIETNYFRINLGNLESAMQYHVEITPLHKKKFKSIMDIFGRKHFATVSYAYDNSTLLFSIKKLAQNDYISGEVEYEREKYKVQIQFTRIVDLTSLHDIYRSLVTPKDALQLVDIVLRSSPASFLLSAGRSFFFKPEGPPNDLKDGMVLYNGFYQSAVRGRNNLYLNVDVAHKAVPKNINLAHAVYEFFGNINLSDGLPKKKFQHDQLSDFLTGLKISYQIPNVPSSKRIYTINGLKSLPASEESFQMDNGKRITVEAYFKNEKKYRLHFPKLPTVWVGNKKKNICLPLELCIIEKDQMNQKTLTDNNKRYMILRTATTTEERKHEIKTAMQRTHFRDNSSDQQFQGFNFTIDDKFLQLDARILDSPVLLYKDDQTVKPLRGQWLKKNNIEFKETGRIQNWRVISCIDKAYANPMDLKSLCEIIYDQSDIRLPAAEGFEIVGNRERDIDIFFEKIKNEKIDLIFVIIPDRQDVYAYVKRAAELKTTCLTQCIKEKTLKSILRGDRNVQTTISNIMLKVNTKLNGTNHILKEPPRILINCMVMGADVTHPKSDKIPSVAAVTASYDAHATKYHVCWRLQGPRVEIIEDMEAVIFEQLKVYRKNNNSYPEKIIYFRDGVSEGQFDKVIDNEIKDIRMACFKVDQNYKPLIACLIVQKRHHTRFFPGKNDREIYDTKNFNVPAGTCVDTEITHPFMQDFYLVSHSSIKGVARPTKYCTIVDDIKLTNDEIEQLTYYLCHLYSRCNRSVSYPAPTYYAHHAAARAKVYITGETLDLSNLDGTYESLIRDNYIREKNPMHFI